MRKTSVQLTFIASLFLISPCAGAQTCGDWYGPIIQSFLPKPSSNSGAIGDQLKQLAMSPPDQYFAAAAQHEEKADAQFISNAIDDPQTLIQLKSALGVFYETGFHLYGVHLDPNELYILPGEQPNAFATGSKIFIYKGLIDFYVNPMAWAVQSGAVQLPPDYTVQQYMALQQALPWQDDWNSIYWVLAHEASHNLMGHRDKAIAWAIRSEYTLYLKSAEDHRRELSIGKAGLGFWHYLGASLSNLLEGFNTSEMLQARESEADAVALTLLQNSQVPLSSATAALSRLGTVIGYDVSGWRSSLTQALCGDHPQIIERLDREQKEISCVAWNGRLCEQHAPFSMLEFFGHLGQDVSGVKQYDEQTEAIANGTVSGTGEIKVEVDRKNAQLLVDDKPTAPGSLALPFGRHTLTAMAAGYRAESSTIVVFPDLHPKIKIKLHKAR